MKWAGILKVAITLLVKGRQTFKMSYTFLVPVNQDNCGIMFDWFQYWLKQYYNICCRPWKVKKKTNVIMSIMRSLSLCNVDVILNHISYGLSLTMYLFFSIWLSSQFQQSLTPKTPSIKEKLAVEKLSVRVN